MSVTEGGRPTLTLRGDWWHLVGPRASLRFLPAGACLVLAVVSATARPLSAFTFGLLVVGCPLGILFMARRSELILSDEGVTDRRLWSVRRWTWREIAVIAFGPVGTSRWGGESAATYLVVCVRNDPYPHALKGIGFGYDLGAAWCLDRIARAGYPVDTRSDAPPDVWWVDDPRRQAAAPEG